MKLHFTRPRLEILSGISTIALALYLIGFRMGYFSTSFIFQSLGLLALFFIAIAVLQESTNSGWRIFIIILVFVWLLKSVFVPRTVPFFGSDAYMTWTATENIRETRWFSILPWSQDIGIVGSQERSFPFTSGFSIAITEMSGLSLLMWGRWGPVTLSIVSALFIYGITLRLYTSQKTALLSALGFGSTYYYVMFHSLFLRESMAFIFFLAMLYLMIKSDYENKFQARVFALVIFLALVSTHHLTAFMLIVLLLLRELVNTINISSKDKTYSYKSSRWVMVIYALVVLLSYWMYLRYTPIRIVNTLIQEAVHGFDVTATVVQAQIPMTSRYILTLVLQGVSALGLGILSIYGLLVFPIADRQWQITSVIWGGMLGGGAGLGFLGIIAGFGSLFSRMEIFGYVLLIPAAAHTICRVQKRSLVWGIILVSIFFMHGAATIFRIHPYLYSTEKPDIVAGEAKTVLLRQEYELLFNLQPSTNSIQGLTYRRLAQISNPSPVYINTDQSKQLLMLQDFSYLILGELDQYALSEELFGLLEVPGINKVYDAGWAELYVPSTYSIWNIHSILQRSGDEKFEEISRGADNLSVLATQWTFTFIVVVFTMWSVYQLLLWIGFYPDTVNHIDFVGAQAVGMTLGLLILFASFLIFDYTQLGVLLFVLPLLTISIVFILYKLSINKKKLPLNIWQRKQIYLIVLFGALIVFGAVFQMITSVPRSESYTEFYLLELDHQQSAIINVINRGANPLTYHLEGFLNGAKFMERSNISLESYEVFEQEIFLPNISLVTRPIKIELVLLSDSVNNIEQSLGFWID